MTLPWLRWPAAFVLLAGAMQGASLDARVETLFRPGQAAQAALSPDGRHLAYTSPTRRGLSIVVVAVEPPGPRRTFPADPNREADFAAGQAPVGLRFLRWATPGRLVFAPEARVLPLPAVAGPDGRLRPNPDGPRIVAPILAADADGQRRGILVDAKQFMTTSAEAKSLADLLRTPQELTATSTEPVHWRMPHLDVLGFLPGQRDQLVVGTHGGFGAPGRHLVDVQTGEVRGYGGDDTAPPGERAIYDWNRLKVVGERTGSGTAPIRWRDDELTFVQRELERKFPRRTVELLDWSETRHRVLVRVTGGNDPGRVFVWQRPEDLVVEVLRVAPWLTPARLHETRPLAWTAPGGLRSEGFVTWPRSARAPSLPLLLRWEDAPGAGGLPGFDAEAQVFADLGFVVLRLGRGSAEVAALAGSDIRRLVASVTGPDPARTVDARRVVAWGRGEGAVHALQAARRAPGEFRAVVVVEPRGAWLDGAGGPPPPLLLLASGSPAVRAPAGWTVERDELPAGFAADDPASRATVYRRIETFLAQHVPAVPAEEAAR